MLSFVRASLRTIICTLRHCTEQCERLCAKMSVCLYVQLMALIGVRKLMDYFYTQQDLYWLDHLLPEDDRRKAEDEGNKLECGVQLVAPQKRPVAVLSSDSVQSSSIIAFSTRIQLLARATNLNLSCLALSAVSLCSKTHLTATLLRQPE